MDAVLIKNIGIVKDSTIDQVDILMNQGKIESIKTSIQSSSNYKIINGTGLVALPGLIDPHVHFRDPGSEYKEDIKSGSRAAAKGGITSFFDMPNTNPETTSIEMMKLKKEKASYSSLINYNFFIGATDVNLDHLIRVENVPGIKIYVGSSTGNLLVDGQDALESIFSKTNRLIAVHSEDEATIVNNRDRYKDSQNVIDHMNIRSSDAAITCTKRLVELAKKYNAKLHICHLTTKEEVEFLSSLTNCPNITCEVTPQHLFLSAPEVYDKWGTFAQINPPIRTEDHRLSLLQALKSGFIDFVASDHAPHTIEEKKLTFGKAPSGMPGVETTLPLLLNYFNQKECSLADIIRWTSLNICKIYGIKNKGQINIGFDADLVLVDLNKKAVVSNDNIISKCGWSTFSGQALQGWPVMTIVNGNIVFRDNEIIEGTSGLEVQFY